MPMPSLVEKVLPKLAFLQESTTLFITLNISIFILDDEIFINNSQLINLMIITGQENLFVTSVLIIKVNFCFLKFKLTCNY